MIRKQGYYSLVQFCPNPARAEVANLGVLLFSPEHEFLEVSISNTLRRVKSIFPQVEYDNDQLKTIIGWLNKRLKVERARIKDKNDLGQFIQTRINDIRLTDPRSIMIEAPDLKLKELYAELVELPKAGEAKLKKPVIRRFPSLDAFFNKTEIINNVEFNKTFDVPISGRTIEVPYVFTNGSVNLVKPELINSFEAAEKWIIDGLLLTRKHGKGEKQQELHVLVECPKRKIKEQVGQLNNEIQEKHVKFYLDTESLLSVLTAKAVYH